MERDPEHALVLLEADDAGLTDLAGAGAVRAAARRDVEAVDVDDADHAFGHLRLLPQRKLRELVGGRVERPHLDVASDERVDEVLGTVELGVGDALAGDVDRARAGAEARGDRLGLGDVGERARERVLRGVLGRVVATASRVDRSAHVRAGSEARSCLLRRHAGEHVMDRPGVVDLGIGDGELESADREDAGVTQLAAALGIEERAAEDDRRLASDLGERCSGRVERGEVRGRPVELLGHDCAVRGAGLG